jgi:hypothetical protein
MLRRFALAVVLILLATPILTFNVRPTKCATVLSQNFDGEPTGSIPKDGMHTIQASLQLMILSTIEVPESQLDMQHTRLSEEPLKNNMDLWSFPLR